MRLLLAEDELALSKALKAILERNKYSVDAVYDGQEALDYLNAGNNYDGVILDIRRCFRYGSTCFVDSFRCGRCNQPLHMQMVGRKEVNFGNRPRLTAP